MNTEVRTELQERSIADDVDINHIVQCHDENVALCGEDITDADWIQDAAPEDQCIVCLDLDDWHCGCECGCCDGDPE